MKLYVASSWRNQTQPEVVKRLREAGHEVYDFRQPEPGNEGFHWSEVDPDWQQWDAAEFIEGLGHEIACLGYAFDRNAMSWAEGCVMVMPCGRSAHIEAGYFHGADKRLVILLEDGEPELMYKMADNLCTSIEEVIEVLREEPTDGTP